MTKTENTINLYDAKQVLEKTFADAARTIWNEIADTRSRSTARTRRSSTCRPTRGPTSWSTA